MKNLLGLGWLLTAALWAGLLPADQAGDAQFKKMVEGLRERQYFDYALLYLDQLAANPNVPAEVKQEIPYEKAMVLLDNSKTVRSPEKQTELLDQAQAYLAQFTKDNPNHPRRGDANSQRAEILLGKARVEILQSRSPNNQATKGEFQSQARKYIEQARKVFETARDQHEAAFKTFPTFIDKENEKDRYDAREQVRTQMMIALLNVCQCRYEEAQTYDSDTPEFKKLLNQAADEFEQLHVQHRGTIGALYAQLYQARCYDDQGDTQKAMGLYNQLLANEGSDRNLRKLQSQTLQFKLEALNRKEPPDSQVVIDLAQQWLKGNTADSRTQVGLAILWQQAVAYEELGDRREADKADKERNWRSARTIAQLINRFPSIYRDVSLAMIQRIDGNLGGRERKPEDFDAAFGLARQSFMAIQELRNEIKEAKDGKSLPPEEIQKLEQDLSQEMHDAAEMFQLALNLANPNDNPKSVATARFWLAYVHFWARRNYEAAILSEFVARTAPRDESQLAIDAAYLSMAAFVQAYNDAAGPPESKLADLGFVIKACDMLSTRWPDSDRANDARMMAGELYSQARMPMEAAAWFTKVPEADVHYAQAQIAAGTAFWRAYLNALRMPDEQRPLPDQLQQWQTAAQQHLRTGLTKLVATTPTEGATPLALVSAKVSLAEILVSLGQDAEAITLLTVDPHSIVNAVTVPDESQRPKTGVQSRTFAVEVYKLLLRAYIGAGKLDEARETMKTLEAIAGGDPAGADITDLYVGLGKRLKEELEGIRNSGNLERLGSLQTSFETFLNDIYQRKEGQTIGTLSWVGETYAALGEAEPPGSLEAGSRFDKAAAAFQEILNQTQANPSFATPDQVLAVKTRLAHCLRMKKDFPAAEKMISELLKEKKDDLRLQVEAGLLYEDWGREEDVPEKLMLAISGNKDNNTLGFGPLAKRIRSNTRGGKHPELLEPYYNAQYHSSLSRYEYALAQKTPKDKRHQLDNAETELTAFAMVTKGVPDEWRDQFNQLFRDVREAQEDPKNRPVVDLNWTGDKVGDARPETNDNQLAEKKTAETKKAEPPPPPRRAISC